MSGPKVQFRRYMSPLQNTFCLSICLLHCSRAYLNIEMSIYHWQQADLFPLKKQRAYCSMCGAFFLPLQFNLQRAWIMSRSLFSTTHSNQEVYPSLVATQYSFSKSSLHFCPKSPRSSYHVSRFCPRTQFKKSKWWPSERMFCSNSRSDRLMCGASALVSAKKIKISILKRHVLFK